MGWNGSGMGGNSTPVKPKVAYPPSEASFAKQSGYRGAKKPSPIRGLVAGGLVIVLATVAYFAFFRGSEKPQAEKAEKTPAKIKTVTPAKAGASDAAATAATHLSASTDAALAQTDTADSAAAAKKAAGPYVLVDRTKGKKKSIFDCHSDHQIARLIKHVPGMPLYGKLNYDRFEEKFLESLKTPIIILANDSEEDKALKNAVRETRLALKDRLDAGEDIAECMRKTEQELQNMAAKRIALTSELNRMRKLDNVNEEDMRATVEAANKILSQRGIEPVAFPEIWYQSMKLHKEQEGETR